MNVLGAMRDTVALLRDAGDVGHRSPECDNTHLRHMLERMENDTLMSYGKMCRWLGWAQGVIVSRGLATLDDMKEINRRHAG